MMSHRHPKSGKTMICIQVDKEVRHAEDGLKSKLTKRGSVSPGASGV
jgi:hypothetical protein